MTIRLALVGFGEIARNQHVPALRADGSYRLAAVVTKDGNPHAGAPGFASLAAMIAAMPGEIDAVAICTPPNVRYEIAREALAAGLGALLEKPPCATVGEIGDLARRAREAGAPLYTAWHSQHASAVDRAAAVLAGQEITALDMVWHEDVRKWHPGQRWIWQPGGFGVFDPGINALSIASRILPCPLLVEEARLFVPADCQSPIAAEIVFRGRNRRARFDWRVSGDEQWTIRVATASAMTVELLRGGETLVIDGVVQDTPKRLEYPSIYRHFADVQRERRVEVDAEPLRITADAFLCGSREAVEPFGE
jgi:predicted dehydrogenase